MSPKHKETAYKTQVENMLTTPYSQAQVSNRWLSKQSIELQKFANKQSIALYLKLKNRNLEIEKEIISIAANLKIANDIHTKYKQMYRKNMSFSPNDIILLNYFEANKFIKKTRVAKKREFVLKHKKQILLWRNIEVSWTNIAIELETKPFNRDQVEISAEYIRRICEKGK